MSDDLKDGDRVRATSGENILVGTLSYWEAGAEWFDIRLDGGQFAQIERYLWNLELIKPPELTTKEILDAMKIGTRFKYHESLGYWIKTGVDMYIYVTSNYNNSGDVFKSAAFGLDGGIEVIEDES